MWYRIGGVRTISSGRRVQPIYDTRVHQVYEVMKADPKSDVISELPPSPDMHNNAVIEFHAATIAVKENIGKFAVTIWRHRNVENQVRVRVQTIDGTARRGEGYVPINEIITFEEEQREKQVIVEIVNDNKWEPNEEFFLRLGLLRHENQNVELGRLSVMEITIIDDENIWKSEGKEADIHLVSTGSLLPMY